MTTVFFVRHAEPNYQNHNDRTRELSVKGLADRVLVTDYFRDTPIDVILSSPYKRAVDTVSHLAQRRGISIKTDERFRERTVDDGWIADFEDFCRRQWEDFHYKRPKGESLHEVQQRNLSALNEMLEKYNEKTIVIGSHGTALSTILHFYDPTFDYCEFNRIKGIMPWIVKFTFAGSSCKEIEEINIFAK